MPIIRWKFAKKTNRKYLFKLGIAIFEYQVTLFKLTNILTSFQEYINNILAKKLNIFVVLYQNNILNYINDKKDNHIITLH